MWYWYHLRGAISSQVCGQKPLAQGEDLAVYMVPLLCPTCPSHWDIQNIGEKKTFFEPPIARGTTACPGTGPSWPLQDQCSVQCLAPQPSHRYT